MAGQPIPGEAFLHWVWGQLHLETAALRTTEGLPVTIIGTGHLNPTDGPDFNMAAVTIGDITHHGTIEIHHTESEWYSHGHHTDPNYNNVILHVVYRSNRPEPVQRANGSRIPTLELRPLLPASLTHLIDTFHQPNRLPCSSLVPFISEEAFIEQLNRAHREYFEAKVQNFTKWVDPELRPTEGWKSALIIALFDGLGISQNRMPMQRVARHLLENCTVNHTVEQWKRAAFDVARLELKGPTHSLQWRRKGVRPNNRPEVRLEQAAVLAHAVSQTKPEVFLKQPPDEIWNRWLQGSPRPGKGRQQVLYAIAFLPALYYLAELGHSSRLAALATSRWQKLRAPLPASITRPFKTADFPTQSYRKKLGAVYQFKHYCTARRCQDCIVLKNAISA